AEHRMRDADLSRNDPCSTVLGPAEIGRDPGATDREDGAAEPRLAKSHRAGARCHVDDSDRDVLPARTQRASRGHDDLLAQWTGGGEVTDGQELRTVPPREAIEA